jgi:hypothetical protein
MRSHALAIQPVEDLYVADQSTGCWLWNHYTESDGYGRIPIGRKKIPAHRFVYEKLVGKVPKGMVLDHLCRNRACVNPAHLEVVTQRENTLRGIGPAAKNARKLRCKNGHLLSGNNLYVCPRGYRECRICRKAAGERAAKRRRQT